MSSVSFRTEFAVQMTCQSCVDAVDKALSSQANIDTYDISLADRRVIVQGHAPPSQIAAALRSTGRQVIVRGAGTASGQHDAAAVCIFESHTPRHHPSYDPDGPSASVHGIARLIQVGEQTILDLVLRSDRLGDERYKAYIARSGDISEGAASTGRVLRELGELHVEKRDGSGSLFTEIDGLHLFEVIGRAMVIAPVSATSASEGILAGVIARSAGAWGSSDANDKTVCSCSGLTLWQEAQLASNL